MLELREHAYIEAENLERKVIALIGDISPKRLATLTQVQRLNILCFTRTLRTSLDHIDMLVKDSMPITKPM
jgi:hypothetical protein